MLKNIFIYGLMYLAMFSCKKEFKEESFQKNVYSKKKYKNSNFKIYPKFLSTGNPSKVKVEFDILSDKYKYLDVNIRYRKEGTSSWQKKDNVSNPFYLDVKTCKTNDCENYELQFSFSDESWSSGGYKTYYYVPSDVNITDVKVIRNSDMNPVKVTFNNHFSNVSHYFQARPLGSEVFYDLYNYLGASKLNYSDLYSMYFSNGKAKEFRIVYGKSQNKNKYYIIGAKKGVTVALFWSDSFWSGTPWELKIDDWSQLKDIKGKKYAIGAVAGFESFKSFEANPKVNIYAYKMNGDKKDGSGGFLLTSGQPYYYFSIYNWSSDVDKYHLICSNKAIINVRAETELSEDTKIYFDALLNKKVDIRYRKKGDSNWTNEYDISSGYAISKHDLRSRHVKYEYQLSFEGEWWSWGGYKTYSFTPKLLSNDNIKNVKAVAGWDAKIYFDNTIDKRIDLRYRIVGDSRWTNIYDIKSGHKIPEDDLIDDTQYEYQLSFEGEWWSWGGYNTYTFSTNGDDGYQE